MPSHDELVKANAAIRAVPVADPARNRTVARPSCVSACAGSSDPRLVVKTTDVPSCTGVPPDLTTEARISDEPPGATVAGVA